MHALSGLEPMIPAIKQLQIYTLDQTVTSIGTQQLSGRFQRQYKDITIINEDKSKANACTDVLTHTHTKKKEKLEHNN